MRPERQLKVWTAVAVVYLLAIALAAIALAGPLVAHDMETRECPFIGVQPIVDPHVVSWIEFNGLNECHDNKFIIKVFHAETGGYLGHRGSRLKNGTMSTYVEVPDARVPFMYEIVFPK